MKTCLCLIARSCY